MCTICSTPCVRPRIAYVHAKGFIDVRRAVCPEICPDYPFAFPVPEARSRGVERGTRLGSRTSLPSRWNSRFAAGGPSGGSGRAENLHIVQNLREKAVVVHALKNGPSRRQAVTVAAGNRTRNLAMFNQAVENRLRHRDLVNQFIDDIVNAQPRRSASEPRARPQSVDGVGGLMGRFVHGSKS